MKVNVNQKELLKALTMVGTAVPIRTTLQILTCVLVRACDSQITLTANDMEIGIETEIPGTIDEEGEIALNAKLFSDIVRKLPAGSVSIESDNATFETVISCEKSRYSISGMDGSDFSTLPESDRDYRFSVPQGALKDMIKKTIFSVADTDANRLMTGELVEVKDGILGITSLEGHRISIRNRRIDDGDSGDRKAVVPGKAMMEISKIIGDSMESPVEISLDRNLALFEFDGARVVSRLIEGNYFKVEQMLTTKYATKIVVNRKEFEDSLERALPLLNDGGRAPVILTVENGKMSVRMKTGIGVLDDEIEVAKDGDDLKIGFNPKFMLDVMTAIEDDEITMCCSGQKSPCIIRDDDGAYIYLVLPVNFVDAG